MTDFAEAALLLLRKVREEAKKEKRMTVSTKVKADVVKRYFRK